MGEADYKKPEKKENKMSEKELTTQIEELKKTNQDLQEVFKRALYLSVCEFMC